ncbi:ribosomal protein L7/L12 [Streptomyces nigra]|uniref:ribosomal protein L7/L12 n=1 Tax=Streptomyces nigra TaxID=1827580 RepID=UPI0036C63FE6
MADEYFLLACDEVPHDVVLTDPGTRAMDVVQVVRRLTGLSLWRSKLLTTQVPAVVLAGVPEEDAAAAVSALRGVGAQAEVRERQEPAFRKH